MTPQFEYTNGNAEVKIYENGTRTIEYDSVLSLDTPLNIDIKVSSECSFGMNPKTGEAFCSFCHESSTTNGIECDYKELRKQLENLPMGIELAIGSNRFTEGLNEFIQWCYGQGYIVNLTINQGHIHRDITRITEAITNGWIKGLGISYRSSLPFNVPQFVLDYENTVFHTIIGIDSYHDVENLSKLGVKKILCLGEKDFGFNLGKVDTTTIEHKQWVWWIGKLFKLFDVVSFDNLAVQQLRLQRYFDSSEWETFFQGEHSFYIDAVNQTFAPSSRSNDKVSWKNYTIKNYFNFIDK